MTMHSKFPGTCSACGERFPAGAVIEWTRGAGARHATPAQCSEAKKARAVRETERPVIDLKPIVDFLNAAKARGLKHPKLRVLALDGKSELRIGLTTKGREPGSLSVVQEGVGFIGCVRPSGTTTSKLSEDCKLQQYLLHVAQDPVKAVKEYAALMCRCSFCGLPLTDAGSVEVGYGPVCAKHWGLPHQPMGTSLLQEVK